MTEIDLPSTICVLQFAYIIKQSRRKIVETARPIVTCTQTSIFPKQIQNLKLAR